MSQSIKAVHTACKNCVFSIYEEKTQIGCSLDYINKYKQIGSDILEVYDEFKEFYVINEKKCLGYRENQWFEQFGLANASLEEKIDKFKQLNYIQYCIGIDLRNIDSISMLKTIINDINSSNIFPKKIVLFRFPQNARLFNYDDTRDVLKQLKGSPQWRIQSMFDNEELEESIVYNFAINNKKQRFLLYISKPTSKIKEIIVKANSMVYDNLQFFNAVSDNEKNSYIFSGALYRYALVEQKRNILSDIKEFIVV